jgi:hypothetical protein
MRHHHGRVPPKEGTVKNEMNPLAGLHGTGRRGIIEVTDPVTEDARCIDHHGTLCGVSDSGFRIGVCDAADQAIRFDKTRHLRVIEDAGPVVKGRPGESDSKPGIIKLSVKIFDPSNRFSLSMFGICSTVSSRDRRWDGARFNFPASAS